MNIEIKEELWEKFKASLIVTDYPDKRASELLARACNHLLERELNKHDNHKENNNEKIF